MWRYILQRLFLFIPTFFGVTLISFMIIHLAPGDPAELLAGGGLGAGLCDSALPPRPSGPARRGSLAIPYGLAATILRAGRINFA